MTSHICINAKQACIDNHIECFKQHVNYNNTNKYNIYSSTALLQNQLEIPQLIHSLMLTSNTGIELDYYAIFRSVCLKGYIDAAKWIYSIDHINRDTIEELYNIEKNRTTINHIQMAIWLESKM